MPQTLIATKSTLLALKRSLELARSGYEMMDRKRNILIREMMGHIGDAEELQSRIDAVFADAYQSLQTANITLGVCDQVAQTVPVDESLSVGLRSVMGVELPRLTATPPTTRLYYGFEKTNSTLDNAYIMFNDLKDFIRRLAETENIVYRLAMAIKKTQKRANALKNIVIPRINAQIAAITDTLEDKDREEFTRLKEIKRKTHL